MWYEDCRSQPGSDSEAATSWCPVRVPGRHVPVFSSLLDPLDRVRLVLFDTRSRSVALAQIAPLRVGIALRAACWPPSVGTARPAPRACSGCAARASPASPCSAAFRNPPRAPRPRLTAALPGWPRRARAAQVARAQVALHPRIALSRAPLGGGATTVQLGSATAPRPTFLTPVPYSWHQPRVHCTSVSPCWVVLAQGANSAAARASSL